MRSGETAIGFNSVNYGWHVKNAAEVRHCLVLEWRWHDHFYNSRIMQLMTDLRGTTLEALREHSVLEVIVGLDVSYDEQEVAGLLVELHNGHELDLGYEFGVERLKGIHTPAFFRILRIFCGAFPKIDCSAKDALELYSGFTEISGADLASGQVLSALSDWFRADRTRAKSGMNFLMSVKDVPNGAIRTALLVGAEFDVLRFFKLALALSSEPRENHRLDAISALGQVTPDGDREKIEATVERLENCVQSPIGVHDQAAAIGSILQLHRRMGDVVALDVEGVLGLVKLNPDPMVRQTVAENLLASSNTFSDSMVSAAFQIMKSATSEYPGTIKTIDSILYGWDLDDDRERVFGFLKELMNGDENTIDLKSLGDFRHRMANGPGGLLGWYVVSLFLTGSNRLSEVAADMLPFRKVKDDLDIDLAPFGLSSPLVLLLARKILGYCILNPECVIQLQLSCLRALPLEDRPELEALLVRFLFVNFPDTIKILDNGSPLNEPIIGSIETIEKALQAYMDGLRTFGICSAFSPDERARKLQGYRHLDFWRKAQQLAEERSIFRDVLARKTMLYGKKMIVYASPDEFGEPVRREIELSKHTHEVQFPRLEAIDPIGFHSEINLFKNEQNIQ